MDLRGTYNIPGYGTLIVISGTYKVNAIEDLKMTMILTSGVNGSIDFDYIIFKPGKARALGSIAVPGFAYLDFEDEEIPYGAILPLIERAVQGTGLDAWMASMVVRRPIDVHRFLTQASGIRNYLPSLTASTVSGLNL